MRYNIEHNINHAGEKPYNQCITCPDIGVSCDGPNFLAMSPERRSEWARIRKEYLHRQDQKWTNAYIAEASGVSKVTVDRFLAGTAGDLRLSSIEAILKVLVNGSWGQYPCANPIENRTPEEQLREVRRLQGIIEDLRREHRENMAHANDDAEKKIYYLKHQVEKLEANLDVAQKKITLLVVALLALAALIVTALVIDRANPELGFIWRATASSISQLP